MSRGGGPATGGAFAIEPHTAERLFDDLAREAKVPVHFHARLAAVRKSGARITELVTEDGTAFRAKMYIDATYEGDLMARAGVSCTLLREGNAKYGETYNGIHYAEIYKPRRDHKKPGPSGRTPSGQGVWDRDFPLDPYVVAGDPNSGLLPLVQAGEPGVPGDPAPGVQAYCFRLCLTTANDRLPIAPPPDYDARRYELVVRFIDACRASATTWTCAGFPSTTRCRTRNGTSTRPPSAETCRGRVGSGPRRVMPGVRKSPRSMRTTIGACCISWPPTRGCRPKCGTRCGVSVCLATNSPTTAAGRTNSTSAKPAAWCPTWC